MSKADTEEYSTVLTAYSASRIRNSYLFEYQNQKATNNQKRILVCSNSFCWHLVPYLALDTDVLIESFYEAYCQERESVEEALQKLADISQNMGVLALGAAIEAGRMGEDGRKFVTAAEEVRVNAEQYTSAVADVLARISGFEETATEAEKQIHALNDLLKENNGSLVKLLEDRDTEAVETDHENVEEETNIEEILESLCQGENEFFEVQSRVLSKAETLRQERKEHKECADELERNVEEVHRFVQTE